jgi:hypothetical protein
MKELGLKVDRIASVHGRTTTIAEFNEATKDVVAARGTL